MNSLQELKLDIVKGNQQLIDTTIVIMHTARTMDALEKQRILIESACRGHSLSTRVLMHMQENGLMSALPLGFLDIFAKRTLTTNVCSTLLPFEAQEIYDRNGVYYGMNAATQRMIIYDRKKQRNANGIIVGTAGSGKSFKAKEEQVQVILNTNDRVRWLDPEREYADLVKALGGEVIDLYPGTDVRINPFDISEEYSSQGDGTVTNPLALKSAVIVSLVEAAMGSALSRDFTSILDRCIQLIYEKWMRTHDPDDVPILQDLYDCLLKQPEGQAQKLARCLEQYTTGTQNLLNGKTTVDVNNRLICYCTNKLDSEVLKDMALVACLNDVWNSIVNSKRDGVYTWFYIDEFHLFLRSKTIREFVLSIWKRCRKFNGIPTGITQNASDLLNNQESAMILSNSDTVIMLNQAENDRRLLTAQYWLSDAEVEAIANAPIGMGIMKTGDPVSGEVIVPFNDAFPMNGQLFKLMNTSSETQIKAQKESMFR
jgi:type IV secretory pathway VirB4 component